MHITRHPNMASLQLASSLFSRLQKMWKKLLRTPLSTILRRRSLSSTSYRWSIDSYSEPQLSTISSSSQEFDGREKPRVSQTPNTHLLAVLGFSGRNFCSDSFEKVVCWNCNAVPGSTTPFLFCQSCRSVQPVDHSVDYFQIFGLEKKFDIDDENLEGKYKDWQKKLHPDLVHSKSKEEREYAAEQSARIIDAYHTLTNPLSRATYIMRLEGVEVDEEITVSEPELLAEIMEIREAVEEAADTQALNEIQVQMREKLKHWSKCFADAFQSKKYEEALTSIQRMTYYKRVNEEIVKKL